MSADQGEAAHLSGIITVPELPASWSEPPVLPNLDQARRFLDLLDAGGVVTFQTFSDREELKRPLIGGAGKPRLYDPFAKVFHGTLAEHEQALGELNSAGVGVFVMVNAGDGVVHDGAQTCRTTANVIKVRALFVDLDGAPIAPVLTCPLPPDWAVQSSPGRWHAYWKVQECPLAAFTSAQSALAIKFGGDPTVKDLPRVMRVPGFVHRKAVPFTSRLLRISVIVTGESGIVTAGVPWGGLRGSQYRFGGQDSGV